MSKTTVFENDLLKLIFQGTAISTVADNAAATPLTNLYVSLHTADPGETGNQTTNETTYTGYARIAVARSSSGWSVVNNVVSPVSAITFGLCTAGIATITHVGIGTSASGTGKLLYAGAVSPSISVYAAVTPSLTTSSTLTED